MADVEDADGRYPKRVRRQASSAAPTSSSSSSSSGGASGAVIAVRAKTPSGRVLVVHANIKEYGRGAKGSKESNRRDFDFSAADYVKMRDSGRPYRAHRNPLLPLPRPTYTEFVNRAKRARMLDRLDFLYVAPDAPQPPRASEVDYGAYERVVWAGVTFRRFSQLWTPERHCFFTQDFRARVRCVLLVAGRHRGLGGLPGDCLHSILAFAAGKRDSVINGYDSLETIHSGAHHVFLPAPGSSGIREALFDAVFGL